MGAASVWCRANWHWEDPKADRQLLNRRMGTLDGSQTDLSVLPEMLVTGFT